MGKQSKSGVAIACAVTALLIVPSAGGAMEVGSKCVSNASVITGLEGTLFPLQAGSLPASAPVAGVATRWIARKQPGPGTLYERLKVLRPTTAKEVEIVAESPLEGVSNGHETFATRIPVRVGDHFGLSGPLGALACTPAGPGEVSGSTLANGQPGTRESFFEATDTQAAVSVVIEPDADGDGYGDESQDSCPTSAAHQDSCPVMFSFGVNARAHESSIVVWINASSDASIKVFGQISWRFQPKKRAAATPSRRHRRLIVGLIGSTQNVPGGKPTRFTLNLPRSVLRQLGNLVPAKYLKARITVSATDPSGRVTNRELTVKLGGRQMRQSHAAATLPG